MPVGSWLGAGNVAKRAAGGPSPVLAQMQKQQPLEGWGTMGQVPGMIAGLSKERTALPAGPAAAPVMMQQAAPSIAQTMTAAAEPARMSTAQKMAEWRARDAANAAAAAPPPPGPEAAVMSGGGLNGLSLPPPVASRGGGFMGGIASRLRELAAPQAPAVQPGGGFESYSPAPSIARAMTRGGRRKGMEY